jgi:hypothetical protein
LVDSLVVVTVQWLWKFKKKKRTFESLVNSTLIPLWYSFFVCDSWQRHSRYRRERQNAAGQTRQFRKDSNVPGVAAREDVYRDVSWPGHRQSQVANEVDIIASFTLQTA